MKLEPCKLPFTWMVAFVVAQPQTEDRDSCGRVGLYPHPAPNELRFYSQEKLVSRPHHKRHFEGSKQLQTMVKDQFDGNTSSNCPRVNAV